MHERSKRLFENERIMVNQGSFDEDLSVLKCEACSLYQIRLIPIFIQANTENKAAHENLLFKRYRLVMSCEMIKIQYD